MLWWYSTFLFGWLVVLFWATLAAPAVLLLPQRTLRRLTAPSGELAPVPMVSVVVPARDEAATVEAALGSLLRLDHPRLEIIAIDDRSRDETGMIMDRLAATDSRLRVLHIADLPDGWLGKCHALSVGAQAATGEYLLFTDGDVLFEPEAIRLAAHYMTQAQLDHLCLLPMMIPGSYFETALICYFSLVFTVGTQPWLVRTSFQRAYVGVGAFNMVRRSAYETVGGHEPIRLDVLDDVKLGKLLKHSGYRSDVLMAEDLVRVRWQTSAWGVICGLEKNGFASLDYSICKLIVVTLVSAAIVYAPYLALCIFRDERVIGYAVAVLLAHGLFALTGNSLTGGWRVAPILPLAAAGFLFAFIRSAVITLREGGVRWRDTFYALAELRKNIYR